MDWWEWVLVIVFGTMPAWGVCLIAYLDGYTFWAPFMGDSRGRRHASK